MGWICLYWKYQCFPTLLASHFLFSHGDLVIFITIILSCWRVHVIGDEESENILNPCLVFSPAHVHPDSYINVKLCNFLSDKVPSQHASLVGIFLNKISHNSTPPGNCLVSLWVTISNNLGANITLWLTKVDRFASHWPTWPMVIALGEMLL